jgi:Na+/melibiose symporter-like transporter
MFLVHNERTKLTATWFNGLATALIAAGFFAPLAALFYGLTELRIGARGIVVMGTVCLAGAAFLHWTGRALLKRLRE